MNILFTFGVDDEGRAPVRPDAQGNMQLFAQGSCNVLGKLDLGPNQPIPYLLYGPNADQPPLRLPVKPDLVFNQIAEPDSHRVALQRCAELCDALSVPVLNDPRRVLANTRDAMSTRLHGVKGLKAPRVIRCAPTSPESVLHVAQREDLPFPWILRTPGEHGGKNMVLVRQREDLPSLNIFPFDGRDYYLMEFVDYADDKGHYHKYRLSVVNGKAIFRHSLFDKNWIVHLRTSKSYMEQSQPGMDMLRHLHELQENFLPTISPVIEEIDNRLGLDFYGIDFGMLPDGTTVLFEANANMNLLSDIGPNIKSVTDDIARSFLEMINNRLG